MTDSNSLEHFHSHVFLGEGHETSECKTWAVIWLCGAMMIIEIVGGLLSPYEYDEPEILRCSSYAFYLIGVEPGQRTGHSCVAFNVK
jgi:hypothetical protein